MTDSDKGGTRQEGGWTISLPLADVLQLHLLYTRLSEIVNGGGMLIAVDVLPLVDIVERLLPDLALLYVLKETHGTDR